MPHAPAPLEVEAKLAVSSERDLRAIAALRHIGAYHLEPRGTAHLHSIYFDTADLVLARHAIALRARRRQRRWEITLKWAGEVSGAVHARPELTEPLARAPKLDGLDLPAAFHRQVSAYAAGRALSPILVSDVRRELVDIFAATDHGTDPLAELALDRVVLHAPDDTGARATYCEIEVEQKQGRRQDIDQVAQLLQRQFELTPSTDTKFSHGVHLLYGPQLAEHEPPLADGSLRRAAQRLVAHHLARLRQSDPGTRLGEDPEAVHHMRVAGRRLRALLRFLHAAFPAQRAEQMRAELRWLNDLLSPVRDCDVQLETLRRYEAALSGGRRVALTSYRTYIVHEREEHRRTLLAALDSKRYRSLLLRLERFEQDRTPVRSAAALVPAADIGRDAMKRAFRHLMRKGDAAGATPAPEELHRIRIRAKRLRYLLEFFRDNSGKPGRRLLKDLVGLQDLLGSHNDAIVAAAFLDRYVTGPGADAKPATVLTLGGFLQEELRRARKARARFHRTWSRFAGKSTVNDWKAVHRLLKRQVALAAARSLREHAARPRGSR